MTSASRNPRGRLRLLSTALLATALAVGTAGPAGATPAASSAPAAATVSAASGPTVKVIVVLKDQLTATPADKGHVSRRAAAAHADQGTVLGRLAGPAPTNLKHFTVGNAFSATVTADQQAALAADPAVASVTEDKPVDIAPTSTKSAGAAVTPKAVTPAATGPAAVPAAVCSTDPNKPTLEPEALQTMNVRSDDPKAKTAAALGIDGTGVKVAYLADGLNPNATGFLRKDGSSAVVDYQDFYGDGLNAPGSGAEAFGDVSAVVAQGNVVYDLATFGNPKVVTYPGGHCYARIVGVAPGASMVALKVGSELLPTSSILQAIDYAVTVDHVDVINESFGSNPIADSGSRNAIQVFDEQAVAAGVTVTTSSGDSGITSTIGNPATSDKVISAGASTDSRNYVQDGYALADTFGNGTWRSNNISALSSAGITQGGRTIDVSAPGESDWAVCDDSGNWSGCTNFAGSYSPFETFGGTSQSAPLTAGVAALVIQAYRKTHGGTSPTPAQVKKFITSTARDLGFSGQDQGSGLVDARAAVEAALTSPGATSATPAASSNITLSTNQLTLSGAPGSTRHGAVTVTNVGTTPLTVVPSTRKYADVGQQNATATISSALPTTPYPTNGSNWYYQKLTFTVPAGTDVLNSSIFWNSGAILGGSGPVVRLSLFDPTGAFASNTRPQGGPVPANYGTVLVRRPLAGTWTAILYSPVNGGFLGTVNFNATFQRAIPVGSVSPSLFTLAPGASRSVSVTLPTALEGGDAAYTMSLGTSSGHQVAVPLIVRTVVPTQSGAGHFAGTITGGNARGFPAQTFSYAFDVPAGRRDVTVSTVLPAAGNVIEAALIDPNGEVPSLEATVDPAVSSTANAVTNVVANPIAGRWRLVITVIGQVTGTVLSQTFQGTVQLNAQKVVAHGVPTNGVIKSGAKKTATVTVTNTTAAPMYVQLDPRLDGKKTFQLAPISGSNTVPMPVSVDDLSGLPIYLVPPQISAVSLAAVADVPTQVELVSPSGGIDVVGDLKTGQNGSTVSTATISESARGRVGQGFYEGWPSEIGPFGPDGAPAATANLVATVTGRPFATSVTSSTGDPYLQGLDPTADPGTPLTVAPGQTKTITVTIASSGRAGQSVRGVLNVVTTPYGVPNGNNTTGDVVAVLPFSYIVS